MSRSVCITLYSIVVFVLFILSMNHWIGWNGRVPYITLCCVVAMGYLLGQKSIEKVVSIKNLLICLTFYLSYLIVAIKIYENVFSTVWLTQFFTFFLPVAGIIIIGVREKLLVFRNIVKFFAYLLVPAIIIYLIDLIIPLPSLGTVRFSSGIEANVEGYGVANFYFFSIESVSGMTESVRRFQGPFLEPGHLGMMAAFLLLAGHHDYHKIENIIIASALFLSLSLAGYILWLFGFICCRYYDGKISLRSLLVFILIIVIVVLFGLLWNSGDNFLNSAILSRLQYDSAKGISGNNRSSLNVDYLFINMLTDWKSFFFGCSDFDLTLLEGEPNNGIKYFMVCNGLIKLFIVFIPYLVMLRSVPDKQWGLIALLFIVLMFCQRTYPYWFSWIICFDYGMYVTKSLNRARRQKLVCEK